MKDLEYYYENLAEEFRGIGDFEILKLAAYERRTDVLEQIAVALRSNKLSDLPTNEKADV